MPNPQPHRFQIRRFGAADGEIRRLRDVMPLQNFPLRGANRRFHVREKFFRRPVRRVRRGEQHSARLEHRQRGGDELAVIFFRAERAVFLRLRKRRRVEHHGVERAAFLRQPPQPVERVAVNEIVRRRVEAVQREIASAPFEIFFREIEAGRPRARLAPRKRKSRRCRRNSSKFPKFRMSDWDCKVEIRRRCGRSAIAGGCRAGPETGRRNSLR